MCTYKGATSSPHSYLMLDWNQTLRKSFQCEATFWEIHKMYRYIIYSKRKRIICNLTMVLPACLRKLRRICRIWKTLIALPSSSKAKKKELLKHLKPDTIKVICECTINIINRNIKVSNWEKRKINRNRDKIRKLVNPRTSKKKKKEILVQEGGAFLAPLLAPVLGSLMGPLVKGI